MAADIGCKMLSEGFDFTVPPLLENTDFCFWQARMKSFVKSSSYKMWRVIEKEFDFKHEKDLLCLNIRAMQILFKGLTENDYQTVKHCSSAKDIWDTLDCIYSANPSFEDKCVNSSSNLSKCISILDEQVEDEANDANISECFHESVNTESQEIGDSLSELNKFDFLSESQGTSLVKSQNFSVLQNVSNLHDFQSTSYHISKIENVSNYCTEKSFGKKELLQSTDYHKNDIQSHIAHNPIICHYCGKSGHISHTCIIRRNSHVRNNYVWIPKGQVRSNANHVGPRFKWVPKHSSRTLLVQGKPRATPAPRKRTYVGSTAATSLSKHKKQCSTTGSRSSISRVNYRRVPYNYLEENKRKRIQKTTRRNHQNSTSHEKVPQSKDKHKGTLWVIRRDQPSA